MIRIPVRSRRQLDHFQSILNSSPGTTDTVGYGSSINSFIDNIWKKD